MRDEEVLQRVMLSNAMLFLLRGVPVVYYGDEQGFVGHGIDQAARQDMFSSQVASYNDQALLGTTATTAQANFDALHPVYRQIAALATWRKQYPGLRRGRQVVRAQSREPGLFAASRLGNDGREILVAFNTSNARDHGAGRDRAEHACVHATAWRLSGAQCARNHRTEAAAPGLRSLRGGNDALKSVLLAGALWASMGLAGAQQGAIAAAGPGAFAGQVDRPFNCG